MTPTKKAILLAAFGAAPEYGLRSTASQVAARLAPLADLQPGTARSYIYAELARLEGSHRMTPDLFPAVLVALFAAGLAVKTTLFSQVPHRRIYWRIKLRMHPGEGFASFAELAWRWSRLAAVRHGKRVRPDLSWRARVAWPATWYSWR